MQLRNRSSEGPKEAQWRERRVPDASRAVCASLCGRGGGLAMASAENANDCGFDGQFAAVRAANRRGISVAMH